MPAPDYEDDLAFEPRKTESLTEDKNYYYYVKWNNNIDVLGLVEINYIKSHNASIEILAPCDYEELLRLKRENVDLQVGEDSLRGLNKIMRRNYDNKVDSLRELLKECKEQLEYHGDLIFCELEGCDKGKTEFKNLLIRINAAIGEEE